MLHQPPYQLLAIGPSNQPRLCRFLCDRVVRPDWWLYATLSHPNYHPPMLYVHLWQIDYPHALESNKIRQFRTSLITTASNVTNFSWIQCAAILTGGVVTELNWCSYLPTFYYHLVPLYRLSDEARTTEHRTHAHKMQPSSCNPFKSTTSKVQCFWHAR